MARDREEQRRERLGPAHEPVAHAGDDPVVGLDEQRVEHRPEPALVEVPGLVVGHRAHAGAHELAVGEDDLHPARGHEVLAVGHVGDAVVERVADDAAPAEVGDRDEQVVVAGLLQGGVEVEPAHAGLDDRVGELGVDLDDAVHRTRLTTALPDARRRAAVAEVLAARARPERDAQLVGDPDEGLDLLRRGGQQHDRGVVGAVVLVPVGVAVLVALGLLDEHRVGAQHLPEARDGLVGERERLRRAHGVASSVFPKAEAIATKRGSTMSHQSGWVRA